MSPALREQFELRTRVQTDALGDVWQAIALDPPGPVRLRVLSAPGLCDPHLCGALLELARRATSIHHPGLPDPVAAGLDAESGAVWLATTWPDGDPLGARLRRDGRMSFAEGLRIAREVAVALDAAWCSERLAHAHLTADRIHLWPEGRVGVLDLGVTAVEVLARAEQSDLLLRLLRAAPHYVAPELARGSAAVDARTDIYSLGAILYHAWTGRLPFGNSPSAEVLDKHLMGFLDDPCELDSELPPEAGWMLERWMSRAPERRPAGWSEALADLDAVAQGRPPGGERLPAGASVIRRGARRDPALAQKLKRPATFARWSRRPLRPGGGTPKVTLPAAAPSSGPVPVARPVSNDNALARILSIAVLLIAGGAWLARDHLRHLFSSPPSLRPAPPPASPGRPAHVPPPPSSAPVAPPSITLEEILGMRPVVTQPLRSTAPQPTDPAAGVAPVAETNGVENHGTDAVASHPLFQKAAGMFNESLQLFREYQQTSRPALLDRVEVLAEEAAHMFEELQRSFPQDRRLRKFAEQSYGMVRYARQRRLSDGHLNGGDPSRSARPSPRPALPAPPSSVAPPPRPDGAATPAPAPAPPAPPRPRELALAPDWNAPLRIGAGLAQELTQIFRIAGPLSAASAGAPSLPGDIPYLEPLDRAAARLGIRPPSGGGTDITFPGFPARTLRYFEFTAPSTDGPFPKGRLIVDRLGQTVGIQWLDDRPAAPMLPEDRFAPTWSVADPIAGRIREKSSYRIGHRGQVRDGVVTMETEIVDPAAPPEIRSLARYRLDLAEPVARLILERPAATP